MSFSSNKKKNNSQIDQQAFNFETLMANSMHDIKNSLSLLLGKIESLCDQQTPKSTNSTEKLESLQLDGEQVKASLINLLSLFRINRHQYYINLEQHSVNELLDSIQAHYTNMLLARGITLKLDCQDELYWFFDRNLIEVTLHSLISNISRYAKHSIILSATINNNFLQLKIQDDGRGYPKHLLENLHTPLNDISYANSNTGLGIYFAKQIAAMHDHRQTQGYIEINNRNGGCFALNLP